MDDWTPTGPDVDVAAPGSGDDWTPQGPDVDVDPQLTSHLAQASKQAGRPVSAWEIGENEPGQTVGEILPLSRDQQGGLHLAVPGVVRGAASIGSRLAGNEPYRYGAGLTPREFSALGFGARPAPGQMFPTWDIPAAQRPSGAAPAGAVPPAGAPPPPVPPAPSVVAPAGSSPFLELLNRPVATIGENAPREPLPVGGIGPGGVGGGAPALTPVAPRMPPAAEGPYSPPAPAAPPGVQTEPGTLPVGVTYAEPPPTAPAATQAPPAEPPPAPTFPPEVGAGAPLAPTAPPGGLGPLTSAGGMAAVGAAGAAAQQPQAPQVVPPPPPPLPRTTSQIQKQDGIGYNSAVRRRATEDAIYQDWQKQWGAYVPNLIPMPPAGMPDRDAEMAADQQRAAIDSPMEPNEIAAGADYQHTLGILDDLQPRMPDGYTIAHLPGHGWALFGPGGSQVPGTMKLAPSGNDLYDMYAKAFALHQSDHEPPHPVTTVTGAATPANPVQVGSPADINAAATRAVEPTAGQARAGNYKKGHLKLGGIDFAIETPAGEMRRDKEHTPPHWQHPAPADYGYAKGPRGADGDHVDVYFGPMAHNAPNLPVYIVDQRQPDGGAFDEHKVMVGFPSLAAARHVYHQAFGDGTGSARLGAMSQVPWATFAYMLKRGVFKKAHAYRSPQEMILEAMREMGVTPGAELVEIAIGAMARLHVSPQEAVLGATRYIAQRAEAHAQAALEEEIAEARRKAEAIDAELRAREKKANEREQRRPGAGEQPDGQGAEPTGPEPIAAEAGEAGGAEPQGGGNVSVAPPEQQVQQGAGTGGERGGEPAAPAGEPVDRPEVGPASVDTEVERAPVGEPEGRPSGDEPAGDQGSIGGLAGENAPGAKASLERTLRDFPDIGRKVGNRVEITPPQWTEAPNGFGYRQYVAGGVAYQEVRAPKAGSGEPPVAIRGLQKDGRTFGELEGTGTLGQALSGEMFAAFASFFGGAHAAIGSDTPPQWALDHAKDIRGQVVWHENDLALLRGFSILSGLPVYSGVKWDGTTALRTRRDISGYQGELFSPTELAKLVAARGRIVDADKKAFDEAPKGPFAEGRIATSEGIDPRLVAWTRQLTQMVGLGGVRIFLADPDDMRDPRSAERYALHGPYAAIQSAALQNEGGGVRRLSNGSYYIAVNKSVRKSVEIEAIAHEIGHILQRESFEKASDGEKGEINGAFGAFLRKNDKVNFQDYIRALRAHSTGKVLGAPGDMRDSKELPGYWRSFSEWFADQVARWATSDEAAVSMLDKLFDRVGRGYQKLAKSAAGDRYKPDALLAQWLNDRVGTMADALPEVKPPATAPPVRQPPPTSSEAAPAPPEPAPAPRPHPLAPKSLGKNADGNPIFVDGRGVRYFVESGVRSYESVGISPTGMEMSGDEHGADWTPVKEEPAPPQPAAEQPESAGEQESKDGTLSGDVRVANAVRDNLEARAAISWRDLIRFGDSAYGGTLADGAYSRDRLYDAAELGVNMFVLANATRIDPTNGLMAAEMAAQWLETVEAHLPTQTVRSGEKETFQQFSTPPTYAFAAAWAANIGKNDRVLEPSAGIGGLLVHAMNAEPAKAWANELSEKRRKMLAQLGADAVFAEDAEQLDNILSPEIKPTVVLMNPPFSTAGTRMPGKMVRGTDGKHIEAAMARLEPRGRLVAIVGEGFKMPAALAASYAIRANIEVAGSVYRKYGTTFGTRLVIIDKVPPPVTGQKPVTGQAKTIPELMRIASSVRSRPAAEQLPSIGSEPGPGEQTGAGVAQEGQGAGGPSGGLPAPTGDVGDREPAEAAGSPGAEPPEPVAGGAPAPVAAGPGTAEGGSGDQLVPQPPASDAGGANRGRAPRAAGGKRPGGSSGTVDRTGSQPDDSGQLAEPDKPVDAVTAALEHAVTTPDQTEITDAVYETYRPQRIRIKGAQPHPGPLVQSSAMASVLPPMVDYTPSLPAGVVENGLLSEPQLEAVTYAGYAHEQMLPKLTPNDPPRRRGYFIGDGTGVGKGREVAGIILDNWTKGRKKAVWISEKAPLLNDARRDWAGVTGNPQDIFIQSKTKPSDAIGNARGILFTTYDTLKSSETTKDATKGQKPKTRLQQLADWLGPDFDGVIAFDESHNLGNAVEMKGKRGKSKPSQKALAGVELQRMLPNARVVYVSATGATEVSNLAYADRLGLWGPETAFANREEFVAKIGKGGIAAMELVSRDMKALGYYTARSLSYDGVEYDRLLHPLTEDQKANYDTLADAWQVVLRNMDKALSITSADLNPRAKSAAKAQFWGAHQRFFNQVVTAMQMPTIIKRIEADVAEGRQAVVQLVNTMEAATERALNKAADNDEVLEDLDITPRDQIAQMVEKSFPVVQYEEYTDEEGSLRSRPVIDSKGNLVLNKEAVALREELLNKIGSVAVPDGPLEMLINHFGPRAIAEVTGRKQRVVRERGEGGKGKTVVEKRPEGSNVAEAAAFQAGQKNILVFSDAGGTGRSYHAENGSGAAGRRRSHYLAQAGWRADKAVQGLGRTHRTNQATAPFFHLVTTDLKGQARFISSIARRLAQLGALTKGERRTGDQGLFSAKDNLESPESIAALRLFVEEMLNGQLAGINTSEFEQATGLRMQSDNGAPLVPEMSQFLNRLLSLKFEQQNTVFDHFGRLLDEVVERAVAAGTLDMGVENFKADAIEMGSSQTVYTDKASGAETKHVVLKIKTRNKATPFDTMMFMRDPEKFVRSKKSGKVFAVSKTAARTDSSGSIVPNYRLDTINDYAYIDADKLDGSRQTNWQPIKDKEEAKRLWEEQSAEMPEFRSSDLHVVTGAVLPIWDRLDGDPKIFRLQTDDGQRILGRVIDQRDLAHTLKALGADASTAKLSIPDLMQKLKDGAYVTLSNRWVIKTSMVADKRLLEIVGPEVNNRGYMLTLGVREERINWRTRFFIPTSQAQEIIEKLTESRPVIEVNDPTVDTDVLRLQSAAGQLMDRPKSWDDIDQDNPDAPWFHQMARPPQPIWNPQVPTNRKIEDYLHALPVVGDAVGTLAGKVFDVSDQMTMSLAPMSHPTATDTSIALAADLANQLRYMRWVATQAIDGLTKKFPRDRLEAMWEAAEVESVAEQAARTTKAVRPAVPVPGGFASLSAEEVQTVQDAMAASQHAFGRAVAAGMIDKDSEIPFYVPHIVVQVGQPGVRVVKDIRTLVLSTLQIHEAVAGRLLINRIDALGRQSGKATVSVGGRPGNIEPMSGVSTFTPRLMHREYGTVPELEAVIPFLPPPDNGEKWFTIEQSPAFFKWTFSHVDAGGMVHFKNVPIFVRGDFEGPLRAVLKKQTTLATKWMRVLKGKMMTSILYGVAHLAVILGRAMPETKRPIPIAMMREGSIAMHNADVMRRFIEWGGGDPVGKRWALHGEQADGELFDRKWGHSWTAQIMGALARPLGKGASDATKRGVDVAGDFVHNKLLWERIGSFQIGLFLKLEREQLHAGFSPIEAAKYAAHLANRWAGALPQESMGQIGNSLANWLLFSRSYRLGNLGLVKDAALGLPGRITASITPRRRKAFGRAARKHILWALAIDLALNTVVADLVQSAVDVTALHRTGAEEINGYLTRFENEGKHLIREPWALLNPFQMMGSLGPMAEHEPGKENRLLVGFEKDGTGIYVRMPWGKFIEDLADYETHPLHALQSALSPVARALTGIYGNEDSLRRAIYEPYIDTTAEDMRAIGDIVSFMADEFGPSTALHAAERIASGEGRGFDAGEIIGGGLGFSISHGFPGGPAQGFAHREKLKNEFEISREMPGWRKRIKAGAEQAASGDQAAQDKATEDRRKVVQEMRARNLSPSAIRSLISYTLHPGTIGRTYKAMRATLPPAQQAMMDAAIRDIERNREAGQSPPAP